MLQQRVERVDPAAEEAADARGTFHVGISYPGIHGDVLEFLGKRPMPISRQTGRFGCYGA